MPSTFHAKRSLAAALLCFLSTSAVAVEITDVAQQDPQQFMHRKAPRAAAGQLRANFAHDTGKHDLRLVKSYADPVSGAKHRIYQQYYRGLPIYGQRVVTHTEAANTADHMNGRYVTGLNAAAINIKPSLTGVQAILKLRKQINRVAKLEHVRGAKAELVIYMQGDKPHLAYHVKFMNKQNGQYRLTHAIIDAHDGKQLKSWNGIGHATSTVKGTGHGGNKKIGRIEYGKHNDYLPVAFHNRQCQMQNQNVLLVDLHHRTDARHKPLSYKCAPPFFFHKDKTEYGAYSVANDAFYFGNAIVNMYQQWYNVNPLKSHLVMRIHFDRNYANAHFDPENNTMNFGDGDDMFYPLVSLDIAGHEISHGFTYQHSDLMYEGEPGAINESFSDMAGKTAEFFAYGKTNWGIGSKIVKPGYGSTCADGTKDALRCMDEPNADEDGSGLGSIGHTSQYKKLVANAAESARSYVREEILYEHLPVELSWLDEPPANLTAQQRDILDYLRAMRDDIQQNILVHTASGVFNKAFYELAQRQGWGIRKAFHVMVYANQYGYWTSDSQYSDAALGTIRAAKVLQYDPQTVINAFSRVGIHCTQNACTTNYGD